MAEEFWLGELASLKLTFSHLKMDGWNTTPLKINMEHNHGGLVQIIFLSKWVICRFQPLIFQGVVSFWEFAYFQGRLLLVSGSPPVNTTKTIDLHVTGKKITQHMSMSIFRSRGKRRCSTTKRCSIMDKGFEPQPNCKLLEVPVEDSWSWYEWWGWIDRTCQARNKKASRLGQVHGWPRLREIVKSDMECRIIQLKLHKAHTDRYLDPHKDKPWYAKVVQADRDLLQKDKKPTHATQGSQIGSRQIPKGWLPTKRWCLLKSWNWSKQRRVWCRLPVYLKLTGRRLKNRPTPTQEEIIYIFQAVIFRGWAVSF